MPRALQGQALGDGSSFWGKGGNLWQPGVSKPYVSQSPSFRNETTAQRESFRDISHGRAGLIRADVPDPKILRADPRNLGKTSIWARIHDLKCADVH